MAQGSDLQPARDEAPLAAWGTSSPGRVRSALERAVAAVPAQALLLSGGIDSSLLAALDRGPVAITVVLEGSESDRKPGPGAGCSRCAAARSYPPGCGDDFRFARAVAEHLGLRWHAVVLSQADALQALGELVRLTNSYDLGLLNSIPIYVGLREAKQRGFQTVWTGEDADMLFGGYQYHRTKSDWPGHLRGAIPKIRPPSSSIAPALGVGIRYPYCHPRVLAVARTLRFSEVIAPCPGSEAGAFVDQFEAGAKQRPTRLWGKLVLRRAARGLLPPRVIWRPKTDLQFGSGMCRLEAALAATVTPMQRRDLAAGGRRFLGDLDAHRGLCLLFETLGLRVTPPVGANDYACPSCGAGVQFGSPHCPTCGGAPGEPSSST